MNDVEADPVIIGGMVLDIQASPTIFAKPRTTTPGKVCSFTFSSLNSSFTVGSLYIFELVC